jgi:hypothetical protein
MGLMLEVIVIAVGVPMIVWSGRSEGVTAIRWRAEASAGNSRCKPARDIWHRPI